MKSFLSRYLPFVILISHLPAFIAHGTDTKSIIAVDAQPTRWTLSTENSTCQIILTADQNLTPGYYGTTAGTKPYEAPDWTATIENGTLLREIPYRGGFIDMAPVLEVIFADQSRELELIYQGYEILEEQGHPVLRLDMKDRHYPLAVSEFIRVLPELDLLEKWLVLKNVGHDDILIEKAYSGSFLLPQGVYDFIQFSGDWGRECIPRRARLTSGSKTIAVRDVRSHQHAGVFMIRPQDEIDEFCGAVWFGGPVWAGNWLITAEINRMERTQIVAGINEWDTSWTLKPGVSFTTPKMVMGCTIGGTAAASISLHHYTLDHLLPQPFNTQPSQVLYNSWYATTFHVNEKDQIKLAEIARDIGVELFVIDDGWFKGRNDDHAGLGDWIPDPQKFPRGLGPMIRKINELGMDFGIWVEPEMVNPNSDLYRAHPEWVLQAPHHTLHTQRYQLVLNFAREDVKDFTIEWLDRLLSENNIKFIKWDMNRYIAEAGWPDADPAMQRELRIRYVDNLYQILKTIRAKHPTVVFETCSGGGGRSNYGMLQVTDQIWTSDNTNVGDRLQIQYGFSHAFPAKVMVNWVTDEAWYGETPSLRFRLLVSMAGNLGIGSNLHLWNDDDKAIARKMIARYKEIRPIIQFGDMYRIGNPLTEDRCAFQYVSRDLSQSVLFVYQTQPSIRAAVSGNRRIVLRGLDPEADYRVFGDIETEIIRGKTLLAGGLSVPLQGNWDGKLIRLERTPADQKEKP